MRIIAGAHRGRPLRAPKGSGTRPTTDRVRESLMSIIASARGGFEGAQVLDAFGGSGALGLEALSRGAGRAVFCEMDRGALAALEANIAALGYSRSEACVAKGDVLKRPPVARGPFDLVFLDPPYALAPEDVLRLLEGLRAGGALAQDVLVSYEHDKAVEGPLDALLAKGPWRSLTRRRWGDTSIDLLELAPLADDSLL